jgi:hypothetical protein
MISVMSASAAESGRGDEEIEIYGIADWGWVKIFC